MTKTPYVLIVEDDAWLAEQYARLLQDAGFRVAIVAHALAAIDAVDDIVPDVMILDLMLVGPNAFTLLHELQSHTDLAEIPIILCTTSADQLVAEDVAVYGVCVVLDKTTMQPSDLVAAVKKLLP